VIIKVKAKPKASKEYVKELSKDFYEVAVKEVPQKGKANERIIELLSEYFNLPKTKIKLISGSASKIKVFELKD